jgi:hypothetical protein
MADSPVEVTFFGPIKPDEEEPAPSWDGDWPVYDR